MKNGCFQLEILPLKESLPLCINCSCYELGRGCLRKRGCLFLPAMIRLEKLLSA